MENATVEIPTSVLWSIETLESNSYDYAILAVPF